MLDYFDSMYSAEYKYDIFPAIYTVFPKCSAKAAKLITQTFFNLQKNLHIFQKSSRLLSENKKQSANIVVKHHNIKTAVTNHLPGVETQPKRDALAVNKLQTWIRSFDDFEAFTTGCWALFMIQNMWSVSKCCCGSFFFLAYVLLK